MLDLTRSHCGVVALRRCGYVAEKSRGCGVRWRCGVLQLVAGGGWYCGEVVAIVAHGHVMWRHVACKY